ncbi:hypothetical protein JZ751_008972 [Albula glossodonta]|uniref:Fibronectin type-III domain-containing protein n=1 Tax=Albula glossodonta TaxID=121402 RepID=A0A8T2P8E3_9TELE|nr:hypothetical protein JZ751_008972 [Albula glossodonta]
MTCAPWCLTVVCTTVSLFSPGCAVLVCNTTVTWNDLAGLLQWNCPVHTSNTTFTVLKKTQGEQWMKVAGCIRVKSRSCDISKVFTEFHLFNWIQLGREETLGSVEWSKPSMVDPLKDMVYSPPTLSVSLQGKNLTVAVKFPCSPVQNKSCSPRDCCPVSVFLDPCNTTITVYGEKPSSKLWTQEDCGMRRMVSRVFTGLEPGQKYCAVASFISSPTSSHTCIFIPDPATTQKIFWLIGVLFFIFMAAVPVLYLLTQRCMSPETLLPKALQSLQNGMSMELGVLCRNSQEDTGGDHLSILSQALSESNCVLTSLPPSEAQDNSQDQDDWYCANAFSMDSSQGHMPWDSGGMGDSLGPADIEHLLNCVVAPTWSQQSSPTSQKGVAGMEPAPPDLFPPPDTLQGHGVSPDIPLRSVRLGACEGEELRVLEWFDLEHPLSETPSPQSTKL